jgi:cathepsin F
MGKKIYSFFILLILSSFLCQELNFLTEDHNSSEEDIFKEFQIKFKKFYSTSEEYQIRFEIFKNNLKILKEKKSHELFQTGITKFFDMRFEEFKTIYLSLKVGDIDKLREELKEVRVENVSGDIPDSFDWRDKGAVTKVKNQYICGSCWTFSTTGNIESLYFLKYNQTKLFSEQQLIDCDNYDHGCNGGYMEGAYKYLIEAGGIMSEEEYYYRGFDDECSFNKQQVKAKIKSYMMVKSQDEGDIKRILLEKGPLSVAFNAETGLYNYLGGIVDFDKQEDCPAVLNHAVLLVGYGTENGKDYWIVKNSWGEDWGEKGYFRISRGKATCGINKYVLTAELE